MPWPPETQTAAPWGSGGASRQATHGLLGSIRTLPKLRRGFNPKGGPFPSKGCPMTIPPASLRLAFGPGRLPSPPMRPVRLAPGELHILALALAQEADPARDAGQHSRADRLDWRAADLREAAR